jgi:undecaprenyl-diphosphatase
LSPKPRALRTMVIQRTRDALHRRPELVALTGFGVAALVLLLVLKIAAEIAEGETMAFDAGVLRAIRSAADGATGPLTAVMLDLTALGDAATLVIVVLLVAGFLVVARKRAMALLLILAAALGTGLVEALKALVDRARPEVVPHWTSFMNASFPSGHAANSAIVYLTLAALIARSVRSHALRIYVMTAAMVLTLAIGLSRLYLGVHWPTDVLAGWILGAAWALLCSSLAWWLQARRSVEPPA